MNILDWNTCYFCGEYTKEEHIVIDINDRVVSLCEECYNREVEKRNIEDWRIQRN